MSSDITDVPNASTRTHRGVAPLLLCWPFRVGALRMSM